MARQQINIKLSDHIHEQLRAKASREGRTTSDVIREYLARGLRKDEAEDGTPQSVAG